MSQAYPPPPKPSSELNTLGLIGLILSIIGFMTIITAPIGLVISLLGLRHPQKGLAIAGTIVGVFSTIFAAIIASIMLMYFGTIGACCCMGLSAAREQQAQETAAKQAVAPLLNESPADIELEGFFHSSFDESSRTSGEAVYTDDAGVKKEVDFSVTLEEIDGQWQATNPTLDSEPRDWVEFDFEEYDDEDEEFDDGSSDEETTLEESPTGEEDATDAPVDGAEDQDALDAVFDEGNEAVAPSSEES